MDNNIKIYKGNIIFTKHIDEFTSCENGYIVVKDNKVIDNYEKLPSEYINAEIVDFGDKLIIPGFVDIHLHAPQFENISLGFDKELMPWLEAYAFPEESKFEDNAYAKNVYENFAKTLWENGTTRSIIFATIHLEATEILMDIFIKNNLSAYIGKVNMDRNCYEKLEENTENSLEKTENFLEKYSNKSQLVKPIITPRFVPTCSPTLMKGLGDLAEKYDAMIQSHLSENKGEIEFVRELHKECKNYTEVYESFGLLRDKKTIMAHCVHSSDEEINILKKYNVFVAHCPTSNINLSSGIAPIKKYLSKGLSIGLGSDVAGGHTVFMPEVIVSAISSSKLNAIYGDKSYGVLTLAESFYLATKGGGIFFDNVGSFEKDYVFDALIIDDNDIKGINDRSLEERLQKFIYNGKPKNIYKRFINGLEISL